MPPSKAKTEIPNPRRILGVSLTNSAQHLSNVIKGILRDPTSHFTLMMLTSIDSSSQIPSTPPSSTSLHTRGFHIQPTNHNPRHNRHSPHTFHPLPRRQQQQQRQHHNQRPSTSHPRRHNPHPPPHHTLLHRFRAHLARPDLHPGRVVCFLSLA